MLSNYLCSPCTHWHSPPVSRAVLNTLNVVCANEVPSVRPQCGKSPPPKCVSCTGQPSLSYPPVLEQQQLAVPLPTSTLPRCSLWRPTLPQVASSAQAAATR